MNKDKDIINIIVDDKPDFSDNIISGIDSDIVTDDESIQKSEKHILKKFGNIPNDLSSTFVKISCAICVIIILLSLSIGIILPKSETSITKQLTSMYNTDKTYVSTKESFDSLSAEVGRLNTDLEEKEKNYVEFTTSQNGLEKIIQENETLENEKDSLESTVSTKQSTFDSLSDTVEKNTTSTVTLTSGTYIVGKNISAGSYNVTGTGSIAISSSGKSRVNDTLKSDGKSYTLNSDEMIKINGKAQFILE